MTALDLPSEDWKRVARRIATAEGPIAWAWAAVPDSEGKWRVAFLSVLGAARIEKRLLRYGPIAFGSELLSPAAAARRFRLGRIGGRSTLSRSLSVTPLEGEAPVLWIDSHPESRYYLAQPGWPQFYFSYWLGVDTFALPVRGPLYGRGLPFYPTLTAALAELVFQVPPTEIQSHMQPQLLVRLPYRRARIGSLRVVEAGVEVSVDQEGDDDLSGHTLHAAWRRESESTRWARANFKVAETGAVTFETEGVPVEMTVVLMGDRGEIIDQRGWSQGYGPSADVLQSLAARVERWLVEGEHDQLEYKQELSEKTKQALADTVAAFANGTGGTILVGVADDASVVGYAREKAADQITSLVRDRVKEAVSVSIDTVEVRGRPVQVVTVPPGDAEARPYRSRDRVMVRVGATTRVAHTWEVRRLASEPTPGIGWNRPPR